MQKPAKCTGAPKHTTQVITFMSLRSHFLMITASLAFCLAPLATAELNPNAVHDAPLTQKQLNEFGQEAQLRFGVIRNFSGSDNQLKAQLQLRNASSVALPRGARNWRIYFHSIRKLLLADDAGLHLSHINGDLYALAPTAHFPGLEVNATLTFEFHSGDWIVSYSDFMPRAFITQEGLEPAVFANTDSEQLSDFVEPFSRPEQQLRFSDDLYPIVTSESRFAENRALNHPQPDTTALATRIIPTPKNIRIRKGTVELNSSWQLRYTGGLTPEANYLSEQLQTLGITLTSAADHIPAQGNTIYLNLGAQLPSESYTLSLDSDAIRLIGSDSAGAFYAVQSLLALLPANTHSQVSLPKLTISDSPRYNWRGMHYDMGRNFHGKAVTLRLIEQMARYKLNKLHLHLTEDEGWRLEIPGLPELTEVGGARCFDLTESRCLLTQLGTGPYKSGSGNGYYTRTDFIEILQFAAALHIDVIPEIDMPGHARAAVKSMEARYRTLIAAGKKAAAEQYLLSDPDDQSHYMSVQNYTDNAINVCLPSSYAFAEKVIYELQQMYRAAGLKLTTFHMGGDEVGKGSWEKSPACTALFAQSDSGVTGVADLKPYFVKKLAAMTQARGLNLAGWEDGLMYDPNNTFNRAEFANKHVLANAWDNIWEWGVADRAYRLANAGYEVILSPGTHLYFDHPQEANAEERGYYWATRYSDNAKVFGFMPDNLYANADKTRAGEPITNLEALVGRPLPSLQKPENLLGIQGQVWSETIRTAEQLEQMIYPRAIALAERAWHKAPWESNQPDLKARAADWTQFAYSLSQKELPKLATTGASFYLPPPGGQIKSDQLMMNSSLPGLGLEYSFDQGATWQPYSKPVSVPPAQATSAQPTLVRAEILLRSRIGEQVSRTTAVIY